MKPVFDNFTAPTADRRKFVLGLLFCSAAALAAWRQPDQRLDYLGRRKLQDLVPRKIGRWSFVTNSGLVVPPEDQLRDTVYSQVLTRIYGDGDNPPIMLLIAQSASQTGFLQVHRPEFCYAAAGRQLSAITPYQVDLGSAVLRAAALDATANGSTEHIVYWTRIGNRMPQSWTEQKVAVAEENLAGIIPDAILVRVSCIELDGSVARQRIGEFIRALIASIGPANRSVFMV